MHIPTIRELVDGDGREATPHLHRHQEERYPAAVCTDADCRLEPKYPLNDAPIDTPEQAAVVGF